MLQRLLWKSIPKPARQTLLSRARVVDRQAINWIMSEKTGVPEAYAQKSCLFIHIPKCAGTSVADALFGGIVSAHLPLWFFERTNPDFFKCAFKFCFVRHPVDRAYSAYRYMRSGGAARDVDMCAVVQRYDSFNSFVRRWMDPETVNSQMHFCPQWEFICDSHKEISMDFIGRYENMAEDFAFICEKLGIESQLKYRNVSSYQEENAISKESIAKLEKIYARDFELFNYQ